MVDGGSGADTLSGGVGSDIFDTGSSDTSSTDDDPSVPSTTTA